MRYNKVSEMVRMLFLFLERNVLNIGLMKKKAFRIFMVGVISALTAFLSFELYYFFKSTNSSVAQISVVLDSYSCSIFMWSFIVFLFVKILFMKKGTLLEFTMQMPVTRKEKNLAVLVFEIVTAIGIVLLLSMSMIIALILRDGTAFFARIICNILFNCVTIYFVFELAYGILGCLCSWFGLEKVKNIIIICILSLLLVCFYVVVIPDVLLSILYTYKEQASTAKILFYMVIAEKYGMGVSLLLFLAVILILGTLIIHIPNNDTDGNNRYAKIGKNITGKHTMFGAYIAAFLRKSDTINYYFIALFIFCMTIAMKVQYGYFIILILSLNSLYGFIETDELRYILMQRKYSVIKDYILLIASQVAYIGLLAMPICLFHGIYNRDITFIGILLLAIIFSVVFFTMAGIFFPAKNENPFSAMLGILFLLIIGILAVAICFFLKLDTIKIIIFMVVLTIFSVLLSMQGLKNLYKKRR
jgi:hypothetical protein